MDDLIIRINKWAEERGFDDDASIQAQLGKVVEEIGEVAHEVNRNRIGDNPLLVDGLGDTMVSLTILAKLCGYDLKECVECAVNAIEKRKGRMINGCWVKEADL